MNHGIICEGCGNVDHGLLFCRKVISPTIVGEWSSNSKGNRSRNKDKDKDKKKRKAEKSASNKYGKDSK